MYPFSGRKGRALLPELGSGAVRIVAAPVSLRQLVLDQELPALPAIVAPGLCGHDVVSRPRAGLRGRGLEAVVELVAGEEALHCAEGRGLLCTGLVGAGVRGDGAEAGEVDGAERGGGRVAAVEAEGGGVPDGHVPAREMAPSVLQRELGARGGGEQRGRHGYAASRVEAPQFTRHIVTSSPTSTPPLPTHAPSPPHHTPRPLLWRPCAPL